MYSSIPFHSRCCYKPEHAVCTHLKLFLRISYPLNLPFGDGGYELEALRSLNSNYDMRNDLVIALLKLTERVGGGHFNLSKKCERVRRGDMNC
jgi:hypothetical protein